MKKKIRYIAVLLVAVLCLGNGMYCMQNVIHAEEEAPQGAEENEIMGKDGEYLIDGQMWHATMDQPSMGNAALSKPFTLIKEGNTYTLKLEFVSLQTGIFTGYLYKLYYFPDWTLDSVPYLGKPVELSVTEYYEGFYDYYNHPDTGVDLLAKGNLYPHYMTMPIAENQSEIWVEVYVPVMESISIGSGTQFAKLLLDWDSVREKKAGDKSETKGNETTKYPQNETTKKPQETKVPVTTKNQETSATNVKLNRKNLADGVYSLQGTMVKTDKKTASMSNDAIHHTLKLTVKKGKYHLTMSFSGLTISAQKGYLGTLKYFKTGYQLNKYGAPTGTLGTATVVSYQEDENGNRLKDSFGTDYPCQVSFELIPEALEDGYVPLQVFVPIMESISAGTGTQPVFLKLDWSTLKETTADDKNFQMSPEKTTAGTNKKKSVKRNSIANQKSTLPQSSLQTSGILSGAGNNTLSSSNSLSDVGDNNLFDTEGNGLEELQNNSEFGQYIFDTQDNEVTPDNTQTTQENNAAISSGDESASKSGAVPVVVSVAAVLAGICYKGKNRGLFR